MICCIFGGAPVCGGVSRDEIPHGAYVIAADGGFRHCKGLGIVPDLVVGDFDSAGEYKEEAQSLPHIIVPCEKDDTDMMLAVKEGFKRGCSDFRLYGALGGRMGHTLANIQTLAYIALHGGNGVIVSDECDILLLGKGRHMIENKGYAYLSLFACSGMARLFAENVKYAGNITLTEDFPLGVSNQFTQADAMIEIFEGKVLAVAEKQ